MNARGTELTIRNATSSDGGRYTVRTSALSHNTSEDPLWIPLLEHYTPLAPVTYTLTEQGKPLLNSVPRLSSMPCAGSKSQLMYIQKSVVTVLTSTCVVRVRARYFNLFFLLY